MQEQSWRLRNAIHYMLLQEPGENMVIIIDRNVRPGWSFSFGKYTTHSASDVKNENEKLMGSRNFKVCSLLLFLVRNRGNWGSAVVRYTRRTMYSHLYGNACR
jgi:hypothetical protein